MNIVVKTENESNEPKSQAFAKLMIGTAAAFIAKALVEEGLGRFFSGRSKTTTTTQS